jgi:hypothetical protein
MPDEPRNAPGPRGTPATPRRAFLRAVALAPVVVAAGCATSRAASPAASPKPTAQPKPAAKPPASGTRQGGPDPARPGAGDADPLVPLRTYPLAADAEPAFVFRAAVAPPGE